MKLKYVSKTSKLNADGSTTQHYYYRRPGSLRIKLGTDPAHIEERWRVLQAQFDAAARLQVRVPGTIADLIAQFYQSPHFQRLSPNTQSLWRISFKTLEAKFGDMSPMALQPHVVHAWKEKLIKKHGMDGARNRIVAFRRLYGWARTAGKMTSDNPFEKPGSFGVKQEPDDPKIWRIQDLRQFLAARRQVKLGGNPTLPNSEMTEEREPPASIRLGLLLGFFSMQRLSDVLSLTGKNLVQDQTGRLWLKLRQRKTKRPVEFPVHQVLAHELIACRVEFGSHELIIRSALGGKYDRFGFRKQFAIWTKAAGLDLTFKALRSSGMVYLAEIGVPTPQIVAVSGHSIHEAQRILDLYIVKTKAAAAAAIKAMEASLPKLDAPPREPSSSRRLPPAARPRHSQAQRKRA